MADNNSPDSAIREGDPPYFGDARCGAERHPIRKKHWTIRHIFILFVFLALVGIFIWSCSEFVAEADLPTEPVGSYLAACDVVDETAPGGFGPCHNLPKQYKGEFPAADGKVSLIAFPSEIIQTPAYEAIRLRLINRSDRTLPFEACDSRLFIVQERLGSVGKWRPLERVPTSWCGNSFHRVFLGTNEYWEFLAPRIKGAQLRFRLDQMDGMALFSKEYQE